MQSSGTAPGPTADLQAVLSRSAQALASGQHDEGASLAEQAQALARDAGDRPAEAQATLHLAEHQWRLGRFEASVLACRQAMAMWAELGGPQEADALCLLALALTELGLHEEALKAAMTAFDKASSGGHARQQVLALNRIGTCYGRLGDPVQSEAFLTRALEQARALGNDEEVLRAVNNLTAAGINGYYDYRAAGRMEDAQRLLENGRRHGEQALQMVKRVGDDYRLAVTQGNVAELLGLAGEYEASYALSREIVALCRRNGYRAPELRTRYNIGEILLLEGRVDEAIAELEATLAELKPDDQETTHLRVHSALYRAYKQAGRYEQSLRHCEAYHAMEYRRAISQREAQARLMVNRVEVELARSENERAQMAVELERLKTRELQAQNRLLAQRAAALERDTREDQLTRLGNRRRVDEDLPRMVERAHQGGRSLCLAVADIDHFKQVNDSFGHAVGDQVLRIVANAFRARTRAGDLVARVGGEEFLVAFSDTTPEVAQRICERLRAAVEQHRWSGLRPGLRVTISIGLAQLQPGETALQLLERSDALLYEAKNAGRNRVSGGDGAAA